MTKPSTSEAFETRVYRKAFEAFMKLFGGAIGNNAATARDLAGTVHEHTSLLLFGDSPVWRKQAIVVNVRIEFGKVLPPEQLQALIDEAKKTPKA